LARQSGHFEHPAKPLDELSFVMLLNRKKEGGFPVSFFFPARHPDHVGQGHFPPGGFFSSVMGGCDMDKYQKQALQVAKEVVIKFIEVGRISPNNFGQNFDVIFKDIMRTITGETAGDGSREAELIEETAGVDKEAETEQGE